MRKKIPDFNGSSNTIHLLDPIEHMKPDEWYKFTQVIKKDVSGKIYVDHTLLEKHKVTK